VQAEGFRCSTTTGVGGLGELGNSTSSSVLDQQGIVMEGNVSKFAGLKVSEIKEKYSEEEVLKEDPAVCALIFPPRRSSKIKLMDCTERFSTMKTKEWVVDGLFEKGTINMIYSMPNVGKSTIAAGIGMSVACGVPWAGRNTAKGKVLFLVSEGVNGFLRRMKAWIKESGNDPSGQAFIQEHTDIKLDSSDADDFRLAIDSIGGVSMIIVDTRRGWMGGRENESDDMARFYTSLRSIARDACVIVLHHESKEGKHPRGSSAEIGDVDSAARLRSGQGKIINLSFSKMRDEDAPSGCAFQIVPIEIDEKDNNGNVVTAAFAKHITQGVVQDEEDDIFRDEEPAPKSKFDQQIVSLLVALSLANDDGDYCTMSKSGQRSASSVLKKYGFSSNETKSVLAEAINGGYVDCEDFQDQHRNTIKKLVVSPGGNAYVKASCAFSTAYATCSAYATANARPADREAGGGA